jgi:uncharacterized protein YceK
MEGGSVRRNVMNRTMPWQGLLVAAAAMLSGCATVSSGTGASISPDSAAMLARARALSVFGPAATFVGSP